MLVSIITVAYNSAVTIEKAIQSVLNQTYNDIEYIVVDGCSSDDTVKIAESYIQKFSDKGMTMKVISERDNGMYDALNKGVRLARGELVGQINTDDWYEINAVEVMVNHYLKDGYEMAWSNLNVITPTGVKVKRAFHKPILTTAGFCHPTMFSKRDVLLNHPYACRAMDDDFDMVLRANRDRVKIRTYSDIIANYTVGGMSTTKSLKNSISRVKMKYKTYRRNGYPRISLIYCLSVELIKYIYGD